MHATQFTVEEDFDPSGSRDFAENLEDAKCKVENLGNGNFNAQTEETIAEFTREGARLEKIKRDKLAEVAIARKALQDWEERAALKNLVVLPLQVAESEMAEFGEPGGFELKKEYEKEDWNKGHMQHCNKEFFLSLIPDMPEEDANTLAWKQTNWVHDHRRQKVKTHWQRIGITKPAAKPPATRKRMQKCEPRVAPPGLPVTMEEFRHLEFVKRLKL